MDAIVNLPSTLATRARMLRPAKAKGANPACFYACCKQAGEKLHKQRDFYLKNGTWLLFWENTTPITLENGTEYHSSFPVMASTLPVPI